MIDITKDPPRKALSICPLLRGIVHEVFAQGDCRKDDIAEQQAGKQDSSLCVWCKAEVWIIDDKGIHVCFWGIKKK